MTPPITLHLLGSGARLPSVERDNTALALDAPAGPWLIDCGGSVYHKLLRQGLMRFAAGADLLLHECALPEPFDGHSSPQKVGQTAAQAAVQQLVIVHYDPEFVLPPDPTLAGIRKGGFMGEVVFAEDGIVLPLFESES